MGQGAGIWILVLVLVIAGVIALLLVLGLRTARRATSEDEGPQRAVRDPAQQILRERFARGDIDEADYEARRRALGAG